METHTKSSWTDDLPVCHSTGAGFTTNQIYKEDGSRQEMHKFSDRSFHCRVDEYTCIYAVFSGQLGSTVAEFALQRIAAEILLGQLNGRSNEDEVKDVLRQAFVSVERGYMDSVDNILTQKAMLQCELEGISQYVSRQYQDILNRLNHINNELTIGSSVVLALIHHGKLYICNIGSCRALLCKNDANNALRVQQLSVDHNLNNEDEILRLCQLGLDIQSFRQSPFTNTRCIGSYSGKSGYKDSAFLSAASSEPIVSQPEIVGAIPLNDSCRFLLLMSQGLCNTLNDVFNGDANLVNKEIVAMAVEQFRVQSTLMGVSQSAVHKVVQMHHDSYMLQVEETASSTFKQRDDITLLVRNFNYPLPNAIQKKINPQVTFNPVVEQHSTERFYSDSDTSNSINSSTINSDYTNTNSSTSSYRQEHLEIYDKNYKIQPYVDFGDYYKNVEIARANGSLPPNIVFEQANEQHTHL